MVNHKIAKLSGIIKRQIYQIISEEGLDITPEQWVLLVNLWENDGQTIGDLVTQSQKDFANVTRIVEKLSKNGYIIKRKNHKDGRSVLLYCTDKVKTIMPHINKCQMLSLNISLKGISQEEQDTLELVDADDDMIAFFLRYLFEVAGFRRCRCSWDSVRAIWKNPSSGPPHRNFWD